MIYERSGPVICDQVPAQLHCDCKTGIMLTTAQAVLLLGDAIVQDHRSISICANFLSADVLVSGVIVAVRIFGG
jgi:hypothetical protein